MQGNSENRRPKHRAVAWTLLILNWVVVASVITCLAAKGDLPDGVLGDLLTSLLLWAVYAVPPISIALSLYFLMSGSQRGMIWSAVLLLPPLTLIAIALA